MSHCVPDFEMDQEDYSIPTTSRTLTSSLAGESEIMELLWQNGQLVAHPQNQRLLSKSSPLSKTTVTPPPPTPPQPPSSAPPNNSLYMAEDEMATWLHYPLEEFYSDFLYSNPAPPPPPPQLPAHQPSTVALSRPIVSLHSPPQQPPQPQPQPRPHVPQSQTPPAGNFQLFSRMRSGNVSQPLTSFRSGLTVVNSSDTRSTAAPTAAAAAPVDSTVVTSAPPATAPQVGRSLTVREGSGDLTMLSSTSASGSACSTPSAPAPTASPNATAATTSTTDVKERSRKSEGEDRKRKGRDMDEYYAAATTTTTTASEPIFEDVELDSADEKKHTRGSSGTKRSRAAEVHNLSERRRRDRINERMRALQELIPRCNKSDKASMLDEAIEYLKSLQMQVQMMSMGCGMVPMMYPGMQQQYIAPMGMGRGMGMDMSMARPLMPFPPTIPGPLMPAPPAVVAPQLPQLAPRMHVPPLVIPSVPATELSRNQASNQADSNRSSFAAQSTGLAQLPNLADPYQYLAFQQMQMQMQMQMQAAQSQSQSQPGSSKPTTKAIDDV